MGINATVHNTISEIQTNHPLDQSYDVSVIIPIYNAERYIENTLDNIAEQSLKNIEIICVDDGSDDNSKDLIQRKAELDCRIKYYYQHNSGAGIARNTGIKASHGKYIAFMDADDSYPDNSVLKLLFEAADQNNALICGGSAIDENGNL